MQCLTAPLVIIILIIVFSIMYDYYYVFQTF